MSSKGGGGDGEGGGNEGKTSPARDKEPGASKFDAGDGGAAAGEGKQNSNSDAGEGKSSSMTAITDDVHPFGKPKQANLVQRFVDFAFKTIHTEMDDFFSEKAKLFDQDWDEFSQQGETLEQYEVSVTRLQLSRSHIKQQATF